MDGTNGARGDRTMSTQNASPLQMGVADTFEGEAYYLQGTQKARVIKGYGVPPEPELFTHNSHHHLHLRAAESFDAVAESVQGPRKLLTMVKPAYRPGKIARLNRVEDAQSQKQVPLSMIHGETPDYTISEAELRAYNLPPMIADEGDLEFGTSGAPSDAFTRRRGQEISFFDQSATLHANKNHAGSSPPSDTSGTNVEHASMERPGHDAQDNSPAPSTSNGDNKALRQQMHSRCSQSKGRQARSGAPMTSSELKTGVDTVWFFIQQNEIRCRRRGRKSSRNRSRLARKPLGGDIDEAINAHDAPPSNTDIHEQERITTLHHCEQLSDDVTLGASAHEKFSSDDESYEDEDDFAFDANSNPSQRKQLSSQDFLENTPIVICQLASASHVPAPASFNEALQLPSHPSSRLKAGHVYDPYDLIVVKEPPKTEPYYVVRFTPCHPGSLR